MNEELLIDGNSRWTLGGVTNDANQFIRNLRINPITGALICTAAVTSSNTMIGSTIPGGHMGSILFLGPGSTLAEDNAHLFYDDANNFVGLGTNTPLATLHVVGSAEFDLGGDATGDVYYRDASGFFVALPIGSTNDVLTVIGGLPSWQSLASSTGYNRIQDNGVNIIQRQILNFVNFFTVTDNAGNSSTDVDINVSELATDTTFIDDLIANNYFTTNLANNNNFITTLTSNTTFIGDVVTIINNAGPTLQIDLTTQVTGILPVPNGGTGASTLTGVLVGNGTSPITGTAIAQGDLFYGSAVNTLVALPKNVTATRYLSNQGTSNNPSWNQVNLADGVTGTLPLANGGTGSSLSDPGANKLWGWDDTDNSIGFWTIGSGLSYDHSSHTISSTGSGFSQTTISKFDDFLNANPVTITTANAGVDPQAIGMVCGELGWTFGASTNATATLTCPAALSGRPGLVTMTSGSSSDSAYLALSGSNLINNSSTNNEFFTWDASSSGSTNMGPMNQGNWTVTGSFKLGATTSEIVEFGLSNIALSTVTRGIFFILDTSVDANWRGQTTDGSGTSQTITTVAADTSYHKFEIIMNSGGTSVEFKIDGSSLGSLTTNIPTEGGIPYFLINGTNKAMTIDYWLMNQTVASR